MSSAHLAKGSSQPPLAGGKVRLYSMAFCPFAHRTRLVLSKKNIPHDIVNVNLQDKPEWIFQLHPEGKVPVVDTGDEVVPESLDSAYFLDQKYPNPPLWSADEEVNQKHKKLIDDFGKVIGVFFQLVQNKEGKGLDSMLGAIEAVLQPYEDELNARGTTFFGGDSPGMLDYMIWPWGERAKVPSTIHQQKLNFPKEKFPHLLAWREAMSEDAAVKATALDSNLHAKFTKGFLAGNVQYDELLQE